MQIKRTFFLILITFSLLFVPYRQCQAGEMLCGCVKKKQGILRITECNSQCLQTEYPVTLKGNSFEDYNALAHFGGKLCWKMYLSETAEGAFNDGPYLLTAEITHIQNARYIVQGKIILTDGNVFVNGSAVAQENALFLTLAKSHRAPSHVSRDIGIFEMRLDTVSLNGTWWGISLSFDNITRIFNNNYSDGTLELSTCPVMSLTY